jgi:hypothetical protein
MTGEALEEHQPVPRVRQGELGPVRRPLQEDEVVREAQAG